MPMLHDIAPHVFSNHYEEKTPQAEDIVLYYEEDKILLQEENEALLLPCLSQLKKASPENLEYLFSIDATSFFLARENIEAEGFSMYPVQLLRETAEPWIGFAGATGWQLNRWEENHQFCSRCGSKMRHSSWERALVCPACNLREYPKISPAVIMAVTDGDRLAMIKGKGSTSGRYHLIAGYVEIGETLEQAVAREVYEEVGLRVKNIKYYKSQPWPFSDTIMVGFTAELDGEDVFTLQESEIAEAKWVKRDEIPPSGASGSVGNELIENFRRGGK
ncbi:MAG: NAD(+) diphosphatase [Christensenellaceae bacterium]|jgi:NAD+ diphosphatase